VQSRSRSARGDVDVGAVDGHESHPSICTPRRRVRSVAPRVDHHLGDSSVTGLLGHSEYKCAGQTEASVIGVDAERLDRRDIDRRLMPSNAARSQRSVFCLGYEVSSEFVTICRLHCIEQRRVETAGCVGIDRRPTLRGERQLWRAPGRQMDPDKVVVSRRRADAISGWYLSVSASATRSRRSRSNGAPTSARQPARSAAERSVSSPAGAGYPC
jgi:hypothetical protein